MFYQKKKKQQKKPSLATKVAARENQELIGKRDTFSKETDKENSRAGIKDMYRNI